MVAADFVSTDDGSGIVHLAPAFGEDDAAVGRAEGLPVLNPVDADGAFDHTRPAFTGRFVKDADRDIIDDLTARGLLVRRGGLRAQLPPLLALRHAAHLLGQDVVVRPHVRAARRAAARERDASAGTPSTSSTAASASGSRATSTGRCRATATGARRCRSGAARDAATTPASARSPSWPSWPGRDLSDLDLHRPYVDDVTVPVPARARAPARRLRAGARRVVRLGLDAVGAAPLPVRGRRTAFDEAFPADFICEAIDQTRGWFYSLLAVNTLVFDSHAVPQRGLPRPHRRRATARRCRSPGAT